LASSRTSSAARKVLEREGPEPALLALSQALPMSPSTSFSMTVTMSTTEAGREAKTFSTKAGEKSPS
jgi:hypothetical protein